VAAPVVAAPVVAAPVVAASVVAAPVVAASVVAAPVVAASVVAAPVVRPTRTVVQSTPAVSDLEDPGFEERKRGHTSLIPHESPQLNRF
jgi:hypothetical protein